MRRLAMGSLLMAGLMWPLQCAAQSTWWESLGDEGLMLLISEGLTNNHDLGVAVDRIEQAEALARRSRAAMLPSLSFDGQGTMAPLDGLGFQFGGFPAGGDVSGPVPSLYYTGSANLSARYRLTSWGSEYRTLQSRRLQTLASRGDRDGVAVGLVTQIVSAYFDAVSAREQIGIVQGQIEASQRLADATRLRYEGGQATALDGLQQRQQVASAKANLPQVRATLRVAIERLYFLVGRDAGAPAPTVGERLPELPRLSEEDVPASLFTAPFDRPDLRGGQARLDASLFDVESASLSRLPTIDLSAGTGYQAFQARSVSTQSTWNAGIVVSLPLFDGFDSSARVREAQANARAARGSLRQFEAQARSEVRSSRAQLEEQVEQLAALQEQLDASSLAYQESRRRYFAGLASFIDVFTSLNGMQAAELNVARLKRTALGSWIELQRATGGSWTRDLDER